VRVCVSARSGGFSWSCKKISVISQSVAVPTWTCILPTWGNRVLRANAALEYHREETAMRIASPDTVQAVQLLLYIEGSEDVNTWRNYSNIAGLSYRASNNCTGVGLGLRPNISPNGTSFLRPLRQNPAEALAGKRPPFPRSSRAAK